MNRPPGATAQTRIIKAWIIYRGWISFGLSNASHVGASNLTYTTVEYSEECWDSLLGAFPTNVDSTSMLIPCVIDGSASACLARYALFKGYHAITFTGLMLGEYATVKRKYVESAWSRSAGNFLTDDTHSGDLQPTTVHIL